MIKKAVVFFWLCFLCASPAFGQDKTSAEHYQKLIQDYRQYQNLIDPFTTKRSRYLTYESIATQVELFEATRNLLSAEIEAIRSYTLFVRSYLAEATQILAYQENLLYVKLDDELAFLSSSNTKLGELTSLTEATKLSADLAKHYEVISRMGYQVKMSVTSQAVHKIFANLKIEKDKLSSFVQASQETRPNYFAVREKINFLENTFTGVSTLISQMDEFQKFKNPDEVFDAERNVQRQSERITEKVSSMIDSYKNIITSLK